MMEFDDMDSQDWTDWIDEYHCVDYWIEIDSCYDPDFFYDDEISDDEDGDCGQLVYS